MIHCQRTLPHPLLYGEKRVDIVVKTYHRPRRDNSKIFADHQLGGSTAVCLMDRQVQGKICRKSEKNDENNEPLKYVEITWKKQVQTFWRTSIRWSIVEWTVCKTDNKTTKTSVGNLGTNWVEKMLENQVPKKDRTTVGSNEELRESIDANYSTI